MASATTKIEALQCFAFAYFAKNTGTIDETHEQNWYDIFNPDNLADPQELRSTYGQYLSGTFSKDQFKKLLLPPGKGEDKGGYQSTKTEKTQRISVHDAVKKVYLVVKKVLSSNLLKQSFSKYVFLDQSDPFTMMVKDACLDRIADAFSMSGKTDLLSPVDMFIVKKLAKTKIYNEFNLHIINASDNQILSNMAWGTTGKNTYRTISNKFFKSGDLIGISLKLPETIGGSGVLKIIGTENVDPKLLNFVDPYTKLIGAMLAHPKDTKKLIQEVIDIEFDNFRITPDLFSWEYPITFRYSDIIDPRTKLKLHNKNLRFKLFTWGSAGFNAQWYSNQDAPGNWTGGASTVPIDELFFKYSEYSTILNELIQLRKEAFFYAIHGSTKDPSSKIPKNLKPDYEKALDDAEKQMILTSDKRSNVGAATRLVKFLEDYSKTKNAYHVYQTHLIKSTTKLMKGASKTVTQDPKRLNAHYVACQCAWFLFRGGPNLHKYLKQRMFLSLFGLITKSGYSIFQGNEDTIMENYLQKKFGQNKKSIAAYHAAPHIVLS
jgi:hypothetical protein